MVSVLKCIAAPFAWHLVLWPFTVSQCGPLTWRSNTFIFKVTVTCDSQEKCLLRGVVCQYLLFHHHPFNQSNCTLCSLSKDSPSALRPSCVHRPSLWFCKDTSQCADGVFSVWQGLVLQSCLFPLRCLASFVAQKYLTACSMFPH